MMIWASLIITAFLHRHELNCHSSKLRIHDNSAIACFTSLSTNNESHENHQFNDCSKKSICSSRRHSLSRITKICFTEMIMSNIITHPCNAQADVEIQDTNTDDQSNPSNIILLEESIWNKLKKEKPSTLNNKNEIDTINEYIDEIIVLAKGTPWKRNRLTGKWRVAYVRPGDNGAGLDRRIPFPELSINESYQQFSSDGSVTNIGELLGPNIRVEVKGLLIEDDLHVDTIPKRFRADISDGDLCAGSFCVKLPIEGVGLFDGVYLGEKIRIGQNLNGGGALVVQIRQDE